MAQDAQEVRHAIRLRRAGGASSPTTFGIPPRATRSRSTARWSPNTRCASAKSWCCSATRDMPDIPGEEVREPAFGMRAYSVLEMFAEDLKREQFTFADNMSVLLTHLSRGHPQQPAAASVLQGHEGAARAPGPRIPQARRRDLHLAHLLSRPAGGAEAAARRARLDPQPAPHHRGHRRDRAACAPHRADRRACPHPHGAADLRRPVAKAACSRCCASATAGTSPSTRASSATPRARCASSTSIRASSRSSARTPPRRSASISRPASASCSSPRPTRAPMCA